MLYSIPSLSDLDHEVLREIEQFRSRLLYSLREPRRWTGNLRRNLQARAIRGSNSIEGYDVSLGDALAAVDEQEPLTTDRRTWAEILGYRTALTYVQQLAKTSPFTFEVSLINSLHFMLLGHDLSKSPGQLRSDSIYVHDDAAGRDVYEGPDPGALPDLMAELVDSLNGQRGASQYVRGAMAHLNLVMIHPYRDGNGRIARTLQTLVLARDGVLAPEFSSIEEYLGTAQNTPQYYAVLAEVGQGGWHPENDASLWVSYNLRAHHMQAQTVLRRIDEAALLVDVVDQLAQEHGLHERTSAALYDAALGLTVRRSSYAETTGLEDGTATRDLRLMVESGLLRTRGQTRGRVYLGGEGLRAAYAAVRRRRQPLTDPYEHAISWGGGRPERLTALTTRE